MQGLIFSAVSYSMSNMDSLKDIMDKVQKLTGALYRVTDLLSDKEPLKWTIRNKAVFIYENIMFFDNLRDKEAVFSEIINNVFQIINILELTLIGTYISNLNFQILKKEYSNLKNLLEGKKESLVGSVVFIGQNFIGHSIGHKGQKSIGQVNSIGHFNINPIKQDGPIGSIGDRKQKILDFLKNQGAKTVGEISLIFSDTSSKTIQRELLDLVKSDRLKAEGDRRWRKYSIA